MVNNKNLDFLAYFSTDILTHYKSKPDIYDVEEDDFGGIIDNINSAYESSSHSLFKVRYGYRKLHDEKISLAAFIPDLHKLPKEENKVWQTFIVENPTFSADDERFEDWVAIYLSPGGKFPRDKISIRPKAKIYRQLNLINAMTSIKFEKQLFINAINPLLNYPSAENTEAYKYAILELYKLIIDGMSQKAIEDIASYLKIELTDSIKRMNSLKEILPADKIKQIYIPLRQCYNKRQKIHGISSEKPQSFEAFNEFNEILLNIGNALSEFRIFLEDSLNLDSEKCLIRLDGKVFFPEFKLTPNIKHVFEEVKKSEGKTISKTEYGKRDSSPKLHENEGLIIHFTDGTSMSVVVNSNAQNLASDYKGLKPNDVHTDLSFYWLPDMKKINSDNITKTTFLDRLFYRVNNILDYLRDNRKV